MKTIASLAIEAAQRCKPCYPAVLLLAGLPAFSQTDTSAFASGTLEEITVTARKRDESLQTTPISITAFSGEGMEARGMTRISDAALATPNLVYQANPGFSGSSNTSAIYIRGIGQFDYLGSIDPGVGLYVDGVYIARSVGGLLDLVDVERVEVLRGPQGTLFGRNTIGGAVSITTRKPGGELGGHVSLTYGEDNRIEAKGSISVPISDAMSLKFAAARLQQDGYVELVQQNGRLLGDRDAVIGGVQARWTPTDRLTVDVSMDYTRDHSNGPPFVMRGADLSSSLFNPSNLPILPPGSPATPGFYVMNPPLDVPTDNFTVLSNYMTTLLGGPDCLGIAQVPYDPLAATNPGCFSRQYLESSLGTNRNAGTLPSFSRSEIGGGSVSLDWAFDAAELVSITAYRELRSEFQRDDDNTPLLIAHLSDRFDQWQFSQELQLKGEAADDRLQWIAGLYYFIEKVDNRNDVQFTPATVRSGGLMDNRSYALFAQGTYAFTPALKLTAGLRGTKDEKTFESGPYQFILESRTPAFAACAGPTAEDCPVNTLTVYGQRNSTLDSKEWSPYLNLAYHWTDDLMTYASFSEGFKSGGFTQRVFPPLATVPVVQPEFVKVYEVGAKLEAFERRLRLNTALFYTSYSDIQVQGFTAATGVAPIYVNGPSARVQGAELELQAAPGAGWQFEASAGYLNDEYQDLPAGLIGLDDSKRFERVSRWTASGAIQREWVLGNAGTLTPRIDWSYRSRFYNDASNIAAISQPDYSLFNASLAWRHDGGAWGVTAGVKNLADEDYIVSAAYNANIRDYSVLPARGREWFVTAAMDF